MNSGDQGINDKALSSCVRFEKIMGWRELRAVRAHGNRTGSGVSHCDPARQDLNWFYSPLQDVDPTDPVDCVRKLMSTDGIRHRANTALATEVLITVSPEFFENDDSEEKAVLTRRWETMTVSWLIEEFGAALAAVRCNNDESTPHISGVLVTSSWNGRNNGTRVLETSRAKFFNTREEHGGRNYSYYQTSYANYVKPLGLKRGTPKKVTGAVNKPPKQMRQETVEALAAAKQAEMEALDMRAEADRILGDAEEFQEQLSFQFEDQQRRDAELRNREATCEAWETSNERAEQKRIAAAEALKQKEFVLEVFASGELFYTRDPDKGMVLRLSEDFSEERVKLCAQYLRKQPEWLRVIKRNPVFFRELGDRAGPVDAKDLASPLRPSPRLSPI